MAGGIEKPVRAGVFVLAVVLAGCTGAQDSGAAVAPLAIPINLKCTTCDDFIRCATTGTVADATTGRAPNTLYRLREKTFWAQVATIGDYLLQFFVTRAEDRRPFTVYRDDGARVITDDDPQRRAVIDVPASRIRLGDASVDQRSGTWFDARGQAIGHCAAVPRRQGYADVRRALGQDPDAGSRTWPEFQKPAECR